MKQASPSATWGAKVSAPYPDYHCPEWALRWERRWSRPGLLVWDSATPQLVSITPPFALQLLAQLRANESWREQGTTIGETVFTLPPASDVTADEATVKEAARSTSEPTSTTAIQRPLISYVPDWLPGVPKLVNLMRLSPAQAEYVYELLEQHEDKLQQAARNAERATITSFRRGHLAFVKEPLRKQARKIDLASRPLPWVRERDIRFVCNLPPNRGTVYLAPEGLVWTGRIERPSYFIHEIPLSTDLEAALQWVEAKLQQALVDDAKQSAQPEPEPTLSLATLTRAHRRRLAPYWVEPSTLESAQVTYQAVITIVHRHIKAQEIELSFGEKQYVDKQYPSLSQVAQRYSLGARDIEPKAHPLIGHYSFTSMTRYGKASAATQQAQRLWEQSGLVTDRATRDILSATFGVCEVETGYTEYIGGVGDWKPSKDREAYFADRAFELTLVHALDLASYRSLHSLNEEFVSNDELLKSMHKRRSASPYLPASARQESQRWLAERGVRASRKN